MTAPLIVLAGVTCFVGLLGLRAGRRSFFGLGALRRRRGGAVFGPLVALGRRWSRSASASARLPDVPGLARARPDAVGSGRFYTVLQHKYYMDDLLHARHREADPGPGRGGVNWFNQHVLDGAVNGAASVTLAASRRRVVRPHRHRRRRQRRGLLDAAVRRRLRTIQTGNVQWYAVVLFAGVVVLAIVFTGSEQESEGTMSLAELGGHDHHVPAGRRRARGHAACRARRTARPRRSAMVVHGGTPRAVDRDRCRLRLRRRPACSSCSTCGGSP